MAPPGLDQSFCLVIASTIDLQLSGAGLGQYLPRGLDLAQLLRIPLPGRNLLGGRVLLRRGHRSYSGRDGLRPAPARHCRLVGLPSAQMAQFLRAAAQAYTARLLVTAHL